MSEYYGDDSPIAAFATTPGYSALTLIRCSGKGSIEAAASVFADKLSKDELSNKKLKEADGYTLVHGWVVTLNEKEKIDEVLISVFRSPKSYTGEDSLDICCHGGLNAGKAVMETLISAGFRAALPGEFTFRAFINGKFDLTRSESVMELVSAKTDDSRKNALTRLCGTLEKEINEIKKMLVEVLSGAEIYLDYSEDEISCDSNEEAGRLPNMDIAAAALLRLKKLSSSWQTQRIYQQGIKAVIAGRPNAGKSCLFNLLVKEDRSIVTDTPGTTRDWIEIWVSLEGIPVCLVDTAGLRDCTDPVEKIGVERSRKLLEEADIVLYLIDGTQGISNEDKIFINSSLPLIPVWNKADISPLLAAHLPCDLSKVISISAKTGQGLAELQGAIISAIKEKMYETATEDSAAPGLSAVQDAALGSQRQKNLVDNAYFALEEALVLADKEEPLDIIAPLLRAAVNALGEITGEVSTADILEEMFSRFCVGK